MGHSMSVLVRTTTLGFHRIRFRYVFPHFQNPVQPFNDALIPINMNENYVLIFKSDNRNDVIIMCFFSFHSFQYIVDTLFVVVVVERNEKWKFALNSNRKCIQIFFFFMNVYMYFDVTATTQITFEM